MGSWCSTAQRLLAQLKFLLTSGIAAFEDTGTHHSHLIATRLPIILLYISLASGCTGGAPTKVISPQATLTPDLFGEAMPASATAAAPTPIPQTQTPVVEIAGTPAATNIEELRAQVRTDGTLRVIVQLNVPFTPEGYLQSEDAVRVQRAAIAQAQDDLLAGLSAYNVVVVSRSTTTPSLVLVIDEAALNYLSQSPLVAYLRPDVMELPAKP